MYCCAVAALAHDSPHGNDLQHIAQVYYRLSYVDRAIEAPEQRLCEDLPKLCQGLSELTAEVINAVVDAAFYSVVLRRYSRTNRYTAAILAYVFGAGAAMTVLAPNFGRLVKKQAALEGSYRQLHSRLRSNAESVAFYGGIDKEGRLLKTKFAELVKHRGRLLATQWRFGIVQVGSWRMHTQHVVPTLRHGVSILTTNSPVTHPFKKTLHTSSQDFFLKYLGATVAVALIIGPFFGGHLRPDNSLQGRAAMLSNMRYHTSVVISLFSALGTLGAASRKALKLAGYADRVAELRSRMQALTGARG